MIIIREVQLNNVFSHENTRISFPDGVISIVGPNGAGKSSIIDAIYIALFAGRNIDVRGGSKEYVVTRGKRSGRIAVTFEAGGRTYLAERNIDVGGTTQAYLYELAGDKKLLRATGVDNVVREIGKLLGLRNYDEGELRKLIRATVLARQDELTEIIDVEDAKRKEWVLSLLGLSYLESALESVREVVKDEKGRAEGELKAKSDRIPRLEKELRDLEKRLSESAAQLGALSRELGELEKSIERLRGQIAKVDIALDRARGLRSALLLKRAAELREVIDRLSPLREWRGERYERVIEDIRRLEGEARRLESELAAAIAEAGELLGSPIRGTEELEKLLRGLEERYNELIKRKGELGERLRIFRDILSKLELSDRCPVCGSRIADPLAVRGRISGEIEGIEGELRLIEGELGDLGAKRERASKLARRALALSSEYSSIAKSLEEKRRELAELEGEAERLCRSLGAWRGDIGECVRSLDELRRELERASAEYEVISKLAGEAPALGADALLNELNSALSELGMEKLVSPAHELIEATIRSLEERRARLGGELEKLMRASAELRSRMGKLEGERAAIEGEIKKRREELEQLRKEVKELERRAKLISLLREFGESFLGKDGRIARSLTKRVREELERRSNIVLRKLELPAIKIDEGFRIYVRAAGDVVPIDNASGGERVGISIALRLALAEIIMGKFPTSLIVDEPTVYLDRDRRSLMFEIIRELGKSLRQLIVVTHDEAVINISDKVLKVEKSGDVSRVFSE